MLGLLREVCDVRAMGSAERRRRQEEIENMSMGQLEHLKTG